MKILLSWLREFVAIPDDPRQVAEDLTVLGLAVDSVSEEDGDTVLELDVTTNRPDCLSHYGVARELAARYGQSLAPFAISKGKPRPRRRNRIVEILATDLCGRYSARVLRGVKVGPSPDWLARRLDRVGIRSINNVADATNYMLMAYGHPLHAFDLARLEGGKIVVRRATDGELFRTLDGVERHLSRDDLVIADKQRPVALAGVMGGLDSEISLHTKNVLLESAWFDPVAVRRTSKRQGLHTEASHRFERGADIGMTLAAADHCIELIRELAGGELDPHTSDVYPQPAAWKSVLLRQSELARHLGTEISAQDVERILSALSFSPRPRGRAAWNCTVPTHRVDVSREIDLIEEVARHYGYDRFPLRLPPSQGQAARQVPHAAKEQRLRTLLLGLGYDEALSPVLISKETERFSPEQGIALANPLSEDACILRTSLVPALLSAVQWNLNRGQETVRLFEIGAVYRRNGDGYREPAVLAMMATGERVEAGWNQPGKQFNFYDLKGDLEQLIALFESASCSFESGDQPHYYHTGKYARIAADGQVLAQFGEVSREVAEARKIRQPVYVAEVSLDQLYRRPARMPRFQPISKFPAVRRDFSLLVPRNVHFELVRQAITSLDIPELVDVTAAEVLYDQPPASLERYSLLLRLTLQSQHTTLTEAALAEYNARIIDRLTRDLGAEVRTAEK